MGAEPLRGDGAVVEGEDPVGQDLIDDARGRMSTHERDMERFLSELHDRLDHLAQTETQLQGEREALAAREQSLAKESQQREAAKLQEMERRLQSAIARFESEGRETIQKILSTAEQRKAALDWLVRWLKP